MHSCLTEFNEEVFREGIHEESYNDGFNDGFSNGFNNGFNEAIITFIHNLPSGDTKESVITQLVKCFNISESDATALVNKHWK